MVYHLVSSKHLDHIRSWFNRVPVAKVIGYHQLAQALRVPALRFRSPRPRVFPTQQSLLLGNSHHPMAVVGGIPTALKNMNSSIGIMTFPIWWEKKTSCSKPPTSISLIYCSGIFWGYLFNLARFWTCLKLGVYPNLWQCLIEKMMINEKFNYNIITLVAWLQTTMYITK